MDPRDLVALLPDVDEVGLLSAHRVPGGRKARTIAANNVMREWWLDEANVIAHARRELDH